MRTKRKGQQVELTLKVYVDADDALLLWSADQLDPNTRGFAIEREIKPAGRTSTTDTDHRCDLTRSPWGYRPLPDAGGPPGYDWHHERTANTFAANLLMPAGLVRRDASNNDSLR